MRHRSISKLKKQKSNPNSVCILIPWVDQRSLCKSSPLESVWLLCSGTKKEFSCGIHGMWHDHHCSLIQRDSSTSTEGNEECCHQALSFFMIMLSHTLQLQRKRLLQRFRWKVFDYPPYSPDLDPSDFNLILHMKWCLGGHYFGTDNVLQTNMEGWLKHRLLWWGYW